jgi:hypothetical protein
MSEIKIHPEKITKPIQLLAAWLAGLFSVDSCFLFAASNMQEGSFESQALILAAIVNVPLFLIAVFLLQTKFRPELQEDSYYSYYLNQKTNQPIKIKKTEAPLIELSHRVAMLETKISTESNLRDFSLSNISVGINSLVEEKDDIKQVLRDNGIVGFSSFEGGTHPGRLAIAISDYLPKELTQTIIGLAKEAGITHYDFFDNKMEGVSEDILFGAYGDAPFEIA